MPDIFESVFDIFYLLFAILTGVFMLVNAQGRILPQLGGALALVLGLGDAFHLLPRVRRALFGYGKYTKKAMGAGIFVSSITMTVFYILLYYFWTHEFCVYAKSLSPVFPVLIWGSAALRIVVCFFPENHWLSGKENKRFSLYRNLPFLVTGICEILLFLMTGNSDGNGMGRMAGAIIVSFACYIPVTLYAKKYPMVGMLMIPKTCAYICMIALIRGAAF